MKKTALFIIITLTGACSFNPFTAPTTRIYQSDMSVTQASVIQTALDNAVNTEEMTGIQLYVRNGTNGMWFGASGTETFDRTTAISTNHTFRIASITKFYTAVLILRMTEDGVFSLDDTVSEWYDGFPQAENITLRMLLQHTAGVPEILRNMGALLKTAFHPHREWSRFELMDMLAGMGSDFTPGERYEYSNGGFMLLGWIAEKATGKSVAELLDQYLFVPLGLSNTYFAPEQMPSSGLLEGYDRSLMPYPNRHNADFVNWSSLAYTSGAMISRCDDMITFIDAVFGGAILSPASVAELTNFMDINDDSTPERDGYGLGTMRYTTDYGVLIGHEGMFIGFHGLLLYLPEKDISIAMMGNTSTYDVVGVLESILALL